MKEKYEAPELEIIDLGEDVITTSAAGEDTPVPSTSADYPQVLK